MVKNIKKHDWNKEQPHDPRTGKFKTKKYSIDNPNKVTWVKVD